uniref:Rab-GAP TBC domain-containing protein n=1 Tax=Arcella intermedia TaxID=1963864 RepID=A0A6B2LC11_9EUKA
MIANNWGSFKELDKTKHKKLHTKVKLGLPSALRGIIWTRLSKSIDAVIPGKYNELLQQRTANTNSNLCPIEKDSPRAFPYHPFFLNEGQTKLQNVLLAYANRNPELGYMSGMHLITAILLFNMDEENAFWMLDTLMKDYQIEGFFLGNREILINAMKQLSHYLENNIPELWEHFVQIGIETIHFAISWFLTLYSYIGDSGSFTMRVLDVFLYEGPSILFRVATAILKHSKAKLLTADFSEVLQHFHSLNETLTPDTILSIAYKLPKTPIIERFYSSDVELQLIMSKK